MKPLVSILIPAYNAKSGSPIRSNPRLTKPGRARRSSWWTMGPPTGRPKSRGDLPRKGSLCVHREPRACGGSKLRLPA